MKFHNLIFLNGTSIESYFHFYVVYNYLTPESVTDIKQNILRSKVITLSAKFHESIMIFKLVVRSSFIRNVAIGKSIHFLEKVLEYIGRLRMH